MTAFDRAKVAAQFLVSLPVAWFGGSISFWIMADGSWVGDFFDAVFPSWVGWIVALIVLWFCRLLLLWFLMTEWVFADVGRQRMKARSEGTPRPTGQDAAGKGS